MISNHDFGKLVATVVDDNKSRGITKVPDGLIDAVIGGCDPGYPYCDNIFTEGGYHDSSWPDYYDYEPSPGGEPPGFIDPNGN